MWGTRLAGDIHAMLTCRERSKPRARCSGADSFRAGVAVTSYASLDILELPEHSDDQSAVSSSSWLNGRSLAALASSSSAPTENLAGGAARVPGIR